MKVKIRDKVYDGNKEPVMVILTGKDKENIANMGKGVYEVLSVTRRR